MTPTPTTTIGLGYRSAINQKINGSIGALRGRYLQRAIRYSGLGQHHAQLARYRQPRFAPEASARNGPCSATVEWTNWSRIGTSNVVQSSGAPALICGWRRCDACHSSIEDGWFFSLGAEYQWNPATDLARRRRLREVADHRPSAHSAACRTTTATGCRLAAPINGPPKISFDAAYSHLFVKEHVDQYHATPAIPGSPASTLHRHRLLSCRYHFGGVPLSLGQSGASAGVEALPQIKCRRLRRKKAGGDAGLFRLTVNGG